MIPSKRGPLVMEVNSSPGLEGIEKATQLDIASKVMDYIEKNVTTRNENNEIVKKTTRKAKKDNIGV